MIMWWYSWVQVWRCAPLEVRKEMVAMGQIQVVSLVGSEGDRAVVIF
jgi:hypothetical protein